MIITSTSSLSSSSQTSITSSIEPSWFSTTLAISVTVRVIFALTRFGLFSFIQSSYASNSCINSDNNPVNHGYFRYRLPKNTTHKTLDRQYSENVKSTSVTQSRCYTRTGNDNLCKSLHLFLAYTLALWYVCILPKRHLTKH